MPIEKRPANPRPKGPPPNSRPAPHRVTDDESFETVARRHGVTVQALLMHNFGTTNPAELNWYLRENVGCKLATHDKQNWRFSRAAIPGLIYIPMQTIVMDPMEIIGRVPGPPADLTSGPPEFLASEKFSHQFKFPPGEPANLGNFLAQASIAVEGELKQPSGWLKTSLDKKKIKLAVEKKLSEDTKAAFGMKFDEESLKPIAEAIAKGSTENLVKAIAKPFEGSIKTAYRWNKIAIVPEIGGELSKTPLVLRVAGEYEDALIYDGAPFKGKFTVKVGINVGLSPKGWAWVAERVGKEALKRYLVQAGRAFAAVAEWLVAEGVLLAGGIAIGTIIGTLGLTYLMAYVVGEAHRKGELRGIATWYGSAYVAKVFGEPRPSGFIVGDTKLRDELIVLGERDAVGDGRYVLTRVSHAAANGSDQQVLDAMRELLMKENNGNYATAKWKLRQGLDEKAQKIVGL